ncbi:uncharacterized protein LOC113795898 isoform X2 [Dermatophagoides pteronyssinus]|uniref:uncharacterized protein LOC113795898 isoform X2 n=1 Tax=Dermatophagoides pteronyssinus TaxID=6956 RepID=UPI003F6646E5
MYNDHRSSYHHHHHQRILPSSTSSLSSTSAISDFRNIKFSNIHHSHHLSSLTPSLSNERLNSSTLNRGKDGIFRPKSIFSLATEIDFDSSSSKLLTRSTARPTIPSSNPRLSYLRDHQGRNSQSLSTSTSTRSQDFLTNFNDNLSYLNTTNTNSKTKYNQNFYNKNSYILPGNYRFTNVYNAPKYRERPLLSNLNRKFGSPSSSTTFNHRNDRRQSGGGGGSSGKGSPIPSSSRHLGKESPTGSIGSTHKSSSSSINDNQSSPSSSLKPKLERNKFLIKFREYDKPPLIIDNNRRSSISWDIPYDHQQLNQPKIDSKQKSNIESIKEIDDVVVVDDDSFNQQQELGVKQIDDMSFMNRTNIIDDGGSGNVIEQQTKSLTPCSLQRWKGSFNLNDDNNGGKDDNNNNLVDDDDKFKNNHLDKFVDLNSLIKEEKQNQEPILLKESLLSTVTTATKIIENQTNEFPEHLISLKAMDLIKPKSKINDSNVEQKPVKKPMKKPLKKDPNDQIRIMKKSEKPKPKRTNSLKLSDSSLMKENLIFKTQIDIPSFNDEIIEIKFDKLLTNFDSNNEKKFAKQLKKSATSELSLSKTIKDDDPVMIGKRKKQPKPINDKMMVDKKSNLEMENDEPKITTVVQNIPKIKIIPEKLDLTTPTESKDEKKKKTTTPDKQVAEKLEKQSDLKTKAKIIKKDDADKSVTSPEIKSPELKSPKLKPKKDQKSETIEQSKFSFNKCNSLEESIVSKVESIVSPPSLPPSSPKSPKIQSSNDEEIIKIKRTKSKNKKSSDQQQQQQSKNNNNNEDSKCQLSNENEIINKDNNKTSASSSLTLQKTSADDNDDNQPKQQQQSDKKKKKKPIKTSKNEKAILNETENVITKLLPSPPPAKQQELRITKSVENESNHQQQISSSLSSSTSLQTKSSSKTITDTNLLSPPTKIKINQQLDPFQQNNDNNRQRRQQRIRFREYCIDDFRFLTVLGRGSFDDDVESIMIERKVLALGTSHPFICKLFCTFQTESHLFFAMELCSGGDLMFHVQKEGKFSENKAKFYASEMICALWFLHKRSIIYRDLKLDNVMIANDGHIRLVDFGMCVGKMYREEFLPSNFCGTPEYMAPEIIKGIKYNHSVDYWALGVVIYEMLVGTSPFNGTDEDELLWNVCNTEVHYPKFLSEQVKNLIVLLLKKNPQERLGLPNSPAGEIVQQQWFHGIQWDSVEKCQLKPPFIPKLAHDADVSYFDQYFTKEIPCITPCEKLINDNDQLLFQGFNYTNHRMTE